MSKVFFYVVFALSLALTGFLGWNLFETHLLSGQIMVIGLAALLLIPLLMFLLQKEKKGKNKKNGFRVVAIVILLFFSLVEGAVSFYVFKYNTKMDEVTEVRTQYTEIKVYVRQDENSDRRIQIAYAVESEYVFGTIANVDTEAVEHARQDLEKKFGRTIRLQAYGSLMDLVKALDEGQVDALLISTGYFDLIDSLPGYEDYTEKLYAVEDFSANVQTEILPQPAVINPEIQEEVVQTMQDPELWENSFCAYLSGIDTFGPVTVRARSDVNVLAVVNTETKTVLLIATPRDYYVPFNFQPAGGAMDKLTHSGVYGIEGSMQALGDFYGLPIQYYLRVNFSGFIDVIDILGGVDVESDADFNYGKYYYHKGVNHLNGHQALGFVRNRYSFAEGDRARGRHQMAVIKGIINSLRSSKILTNYTELMDQMSGCFQTNASKSMIGELVQLTMDPNKPDWNVLTYSVDGWGESNYTYTLGCYAYTMVPDPVTVEYARSLAISVASGEILTQDQIRENAPVHEKLPPSARG